MPNIHDVEGLKKLLDDLGQATTKGFAAFRKEVDELKQNIASVMTQNATTIREQKEKVEKMDSDLQFFGENVEEWKIYINAQMEQHKNAIIMLF